MHGRKERSGFCSLGPSWLWKLRLEPSDALPVIQYIGRFQILRTKVFSFKSTNSITHMSGAGTWIHHTGTMLIIHHYNRQHIKQWQLTSRFISSLLQSTSISNLRCSFISGSLWSSAKTFMIAMVQGLGALNTRLLAQDSITLATKGITYCISC